MADISTVIAIHWGAEHRDKEGNLISKQVSIQSPGLLRCIKLSCLWRYVLKAIRYAFITYYHKFRVEYAEKNRNKTIPLKYRTGEPMSESIPGAMWAIIKIRTRR